MSMLDLSGADTSGFSAIPSGRYNCTVYSAEWKATKGGPGAKLPEGTRFLNVQYAVQDETAPDGIKVKNRRLFGTFMLPEKPDGIDADKLAKMQGMFVNFLVAAGYDEKKIKTGKFTFEIDDLTGRELVVVVGQKPKYNGAEGEMDNEVKGYKPAGTDTGAGTGKSGLI